jgi:hypothetical protein
MNRQKSAPRCRPSTYLTLLVTAVIVAGGGVTHAVFKNRQIQVTREIDAIDLKIKQYRLDILTTQMRTESLLDRYLIKEQLKVTGSALVRIPPGVAEEVNPSAPSAVASVTP